MSALNDFIAYCISEYRCPGRCTSCKNDKRCNNAQNCYIPCIKHIHDVNNSSSHYNCENMALCYILKHFYRFSAEIEAALERHIKIPLNRQLHFASIGCGPASELFGITNFLEHHPNSNLSFTYKGFDERPDSAAAQLLEGSVLIMVDNSPQVMVLPSTIFDFMQESNDFYFPPLTGTYIRVVRYIVFFQKKSDYGKKCNNPRISKHLRLFTLTRFYLSFRRVW